MTTPDDRESKPESSPTPEKPQVWLPPRLRDKLDSSGGGGGDEDFDFLNRKSSPVGLIITIVVIVAAVAGIALMVHNSKEKAKAEAAEAAQQAAAERAVVVADSLAQVAQADSLKAVAVADSIAFAKLPKWKQRQILAQKAKAAGGSTPTTTSPSGAAAGAAGAAGTTPAAGTAAAPAPAEPPPPREKGPYGIDAGQYLDESKANQVAEDLKAKTGLAARVMNMNDTFHVVLGSFSSRAAADAKANTLLAKSLVEQGGVVSLSEEKK